MYIVGNRSFPSPEEAERYCNMCDFDPAEMIQKEKSIYWYEYKYRGFSPGCQPSGFVNVDHNKGKFGHIAYNKPLTSQEVDEYELKEVK